MLYTGCLCTTRNIPDLRGQTSPDFDMYLICKKCDLVFVLIRNAESPASSEFTLGCIISHKNNSHISDQQQALGIRSREQKTRAPRRTDTTCCRRFNKLLQSIRLRCPNPHHVLRLSENPGDIEYDIVVHVHSVCTA